MFNGVGLRTPRGSGTNGYVQRSLATLPTNKIVKLSNQSDTITRPKSRVDPSILLHERKREIELKLLQLRTTLSGSMTDEEIDSEIQKQREFMLNNLNSVSLDITRNEHIMAQVKKNQMDNLQQVLRIPDVPSKGGVTTNKTSNGDRNNTTPVKNTNARPNPVSSSSTSISRDGSGDFSSSDESRYTSSRDSSVSSSRSKSDTYERRKYKGRSRSKSYTRNSRRNRSSSRDSLSSSYSRTSSSYISYSSDSYGSYDRRRNINTRTSRYKKSPSLSSYSSSSSDSYSRSRSSSRRRY